MAFLTTHEPSQMMKTLIGGAIDLTHSCNFVSKRKALMFLDWEE